MARDSGDESGKTICNTPFSVELGVLPRICDVGTLARLPRPRPPSVKVALIPPVADGDAQQLEAIRKDDESDDQDWQSVHASVRMVKFPRGRRHVAGVFFFCCSFSRERASRC